MNFGFKTTIIKLLDFFVNLWFTWSWIRIDAYDCKCFY